MGKIIKSLLLVISMLFFTGVAYASTPTLSVRIEQPKSPTNSNNFNVTFVASDPQNNAVSVICYKKGPTDGGFSQFDSTKTLPSGGGSDNCNVTSSVVTQDGTYSFYVSASDGTNTAISTTVTVDINTSGPGTPTNYSKSHNDSCHNIISFRTADDNGKTAKVEIYRSETTTLVANSGSRITSIATGSNNNLTYTDTVPNCNKIYYYAVRAFDSAGNGSGLVGDGELTATINSTSTSTTSGGATPTSAASGTSQGGGAIPVTTSGVTPGAGESLTGTPAPTSGEKTVLGATKAPTEEPSGVGGFFSKITNWLLGLGVIVVLGIAFWVWRSRSK